MAAAVTCIVGIAQNGVVLLGGDSAAVEDRHYLARTKHPKVFRNGEYLIGYTSSFRMGQLLEFAELPALDERDAYHFMATSFVERIRQIMRDGGYMKRDNEREEGGSFLVGIKGRLFQIDCDYHAQESLDGYTAVGCGVSVALGSLFSSAHMPMQDRAMLALRAAEQFTTGVRAPFHLVTT